MQTEHLTDTKHLAAKSTLNIKQMSVRGEAPLSCAAPIDTHPITSDNTGAFPTPTQLQRQCTLTGASLSCVWVQRPAPRSATSP